MRHGRTTAAAATRRSVPTAIAVAALVLLAATFTWWPASAYAVTPIASEPGNRQRLTDPPGAVTLAFSRDVDPGVAKMIVTGPDGSNVTDGALIVEGTNVTSQLQDGLPEGTYTVHYRIDRADGEPEGGAYQFAVGQGSFTTLPDRSWSGSAQEPAVLGGTNPNGSDEPDPPSTAPTDTPGIQVTEEASTGDPTPTDTAKPSTIEPPAGPTTDLASDTEPATEDSATPAPAPGSGSTPFVVGGVLVAAAAVGAGLGIWRTRRGRPPTHD